MLECVVSAGQGLLVYVLLGVKERDLVIGTGAVAFVRHVNLHHDSCLQIEAAPCQRGTSLSRVRHLAASHDCLSVQYKPLICRLDYT